MKPHNCIRFYTNSKNKPLLTIKYKNKLYLLLSQNLVFQNKSKVKIIFYYLVHYLFNRTK